MRLATFIDSNLEEIIAEWVVFARTCLPASDSMDLDELRDHAAQMLVAIAKDLGEPQTEHERWEKSMGRAPRMADSPDRPSETHAALRFGSGFTMMQMVSEYRALRASVLRLWINAKGAADETDLEDMTRFNEAVDQALAESTARFVEKWRESEALFVGILGHDLRNPLGVLRNSADLVASGEIDESTKDIMLRSAKRMEALIEDMIAFAQGQYGKGIPIQRESVDLSEIAHRVLGEFAILHYNRQVNLEASGNLWGQWDGARLGQVISNLVGNAIVYGDTEQPIGVKLEGRIDDVALTVQNFGQVIPKSEINMIFSPMTQVKNGGALRKGARGAGLGLYIACEITAAHGGEIDVESTKERGTIFKVTLPRSG